MRIKLLFSSHATTHQHKTCSHVAPARYVEYMKHYFLRSSWCGLSSFLFPSDHEHLGSTLGGMYPSGIAMLLSMWAHVPALALP